MKINNYTQNIERRRQFEANQSFAIINSNILNGGSGSSTGI
jgi:hypothetical protein